MLVLGDSMVASLEWFDCRLLPWPESNAARVSTFVHGLPRWGANILPQLVYIRDILRGFGNSLVGHGAAS
jgi:hypothetical protein